VVTVEGSAVDPDPYVFEPFRIRLKILTKTSKKSKKNLDFYYIVTPFLLFIFEYWRKCTFKSNKQKTVKKNSFLLVSCQPLRQKAGSRYGSADPYQKCNGSTTLADGADQWFDGIFDTLILGKYLWSGIRFFCWMPPGSPCQPTMRTTLSDGREKIDETLVSYSIYQKKPIGYGEKKLQYRRGEIPIPKDTFQWTSLLLQEMFFKTWACTYITAPD
jgi:hypothetical protein